MLLIITLLALIVPWTIVEGRGCWADGQTKQYIPCQYGTVIHGDIEYGIQYNLTSLFSPICCEGLSCKISTNRCQFEHVGCGQSVNGLPVQTTQVHWEFTGIEPIMRCYDQGPYNGAYYSYTVIIAPID